MADSSKYFSRVASSKRCTRIGKLKLLTYKIQSGVRKLLNYQKRETIVDHAYD